MIRYKEIVYTSNMENEQRNEIENWLENNCEFNEDRTKFAYVTSNYTNESCFDVIFRDNFEAATLFGLIYPNSKIVNIDQEIIWEVTDHHFNNLFEVR